jgi:TolB-like protein
VTLLMLGGSGVAGDRGARASNVRSIAVLPLRNLSGDSTRQYFVDAMHQELITALAQIPDLTVILRTSVQSYSENKPSIHAIARELGVNALVTGSVFPSGDAIRINIQVVYGLTEEIVWTHSDSGEIGDALGLQGRVADAIARAIGVRVSPAIKARMERRQPVAPEAEAAYMLGRHYAQLTSSGPMMSREDRQVAARKAIQHFQDATSLSPDWAEAHAALAGAYHWLVRPTPYNARDSVLRLAKQEAQRALKLDDENAEAHAALGRALYTLDRDWDGAEREILRAIEIDPNSNHWNYAHFLAAAGRQDEALEQFRLAEERDPLSDLLKWQIANAYFNAGILKEGLRHVEELGERLRGADGLNEAEWRTGFGVVPFKIQTLSLMGRHDEAIALAETEVAPTQD